MALTQDERERVLDLWSKQVGINEIVRMTGHGRNTIRRLIREAEDNVAAPEDELAKASAFIETLRRSPRLRHQLRVVLGLVAQNDRLSGDDDV